MRPFVVYIKGTFMLPILTTLFSMLSSIPGTLGKYFETKATIEKIKLDTQKEIALTQLKAAAEMGIAETNKSKAALGATSPTFKYFTFFMWFGPFIIGTTFPKYSADIFLNLGSMPEWYVQSCMIIMFTVWGITVSKEAIGNVFSSLGGYFGSKRHHKEVMAKIDRKALFDDLRDVIFKQGMTQLQVKEIERALDEQGA